MVIPFYLQFLLTVWLLMSGAFIFACVFTMIIYERQSKIEEVYMSSVIDHNGELLIELISLNSNIKRMRDQVQKKHEEDKKIWKKHNSKTS